MEKGNNKGSRSSGYEFGKEMLCDVGLGLRTQSYSSSPTKKMALLPPNYDNNFGGGGGGHANTTTIGCGSMFSTNSATSGGGVVMDADGSGKVVFTAAQWQELERQTMIYKYMMASLPVPPQLLFTSTKTPLSQSNMGGLDLRFGSGSDPEPWRCKRTDGKKWRCSRDVAPDHRYCERHLHKNKPRSRKPVEIQSHTPPSIPFNQNRDHNEHHSLLSPANANNLVPKTCSHYPNMVSASSHTQTRCPDWFMKSGTNVNPPSPRVGSKRDYTASDQNGLAFQQNYDQDYRPSMDMSFEREGSSETTRHFIDAWSVGNNDGGDEVGNNSKCSLTLSMQSGGNGNEIDENYQMSDGINSDQTSWMGGPLGEALCLGIASSVKGSSNVPSPRPYSNRTTSSSLCEEGGRGFHFC